jgi:hypothetical protein
LGMAERFFTARMPRLLAAVELLVMRDGFP